MNKIKYNYCIMRTVVIEPMLNVLTKLKYPEKIANSINGKISIQLQ